jgi:hypothetical protein
MSNRQPNGMTVASYIAAVLAFLIASSISPALAGPVATLSRTAIDFGSPAGPTSTVQAVFVTNTGDAPLAISGTSITGAEAAFFSVAGTCTPPISLPPNARCRLDFTMNASGLLPTRQATFSLQSDSPAPPASITLSGLRASLGSTVFKTTDWLDFPATPLGGSAAPQSITFQNNEDFLSFGITGINLVGGNSTDFSLTSTCVVGGGVPAAPGCMATIGFLPTAPGPRSTELQFDFTFGGSPRRFTFSITGVGGTAGPSPTLTIVEYHHAAFDHYFITPVAAEIALLDAHAPPFQDWSRTGFTFNAYPNAAAPAGSVAICRFFNDHYAPKSSHFYAPHGFGCETTLAMFPDWGLEDDKLFNTMLPDAAGACPVGTIPVYRLYNNGMGQAPNHRLVTSLAERQTMINRGFVAEGNGIGVSMCVPP